MTPITRYRRRFEDAGEAPALAAVSETVVDPAHAAPPARGDRASAARVRRGARGGARLRRPGQGQARVLPRALGAPDRGAAPRRDCPDGSARAGARGADRRRRHRDGARARRSPSTGSRSRSARRARPRSTPGTRTRSSATCRLRTSTSTAATRRATDTRASACPRCSIRASRGSTSRPASGSRSACSRRRSRGMQPPAGSPAARCRGSPRRRSSIRPAPSPKWPREPGPHRRDRGRLLGLLPVSPVLPRPPRGRPCRRRPQGRLGPRRLPERVRARGGDELRRRAPCRRRRRRRRLVAAQPPPRARGRGARGRCPRARREADDSDTRRRGGARGCRRGSRPGGGGRLRLELLAADGLGEGGARARAPRADHVRHRPTCPAASPISSRARAVRGRRRGRVRGGGGDRDVGPVGCRRRLPLRAAVPPARPRALARPERARGRVRRARSCSTTGSTSTSRSRSGSRAG